MATTNLINADGTFKCVLQGFSQLYIFHAVVKNNVSIPMLFCLVKGKTSKAYTKLLGLVEELAAENGTPVFNRQVTLMCDFEAPFIKAVQTHYTLVEVKCCFFHFTKIIRTHRQPIMNAIERAEGEKSEAYRMAQTTKNMLMMLPLLPEELAIPQVIGLIHRAWTDSCPDHRDAFNGLFATVIRTYVGTPPGYPDPVRPLFRPSIWSVSGRSIRTNNSAESVHAHLNTKVNGAVSLHLFLSIIEDQMLQGRKRIRKGCKSHSRAVEQAKNRLLAEELDKLLNGRVGVIDYLDNCVSITRLQTVERANRIELMTTALMCGLRRIAHSSERLVEVFTTGSSLEVRCWMPRSRPTSPCGPSKFLNRSLLTNVTTRFSHWSKMVLTKASWSSAGDMKTILLKEQTEMNALRIMTKGTTGSTMNRIPPSISQGLFSSPSLFLSPGQSSRFHRELPNGNYNPSRDTDLVPVSIIDGDLMKTMFVCDDMQWE